MKKIKLKAKISMVVGGLWSFSGIFALSAVVGNESISKIRVLANAVFEAVIFFGIGFTLLGTGIYLLLKNGEITDVKYTIANVECNNEEIVIYPFLLGLLKSILNYKIIINEGHLYIIKGEMKKEVKISEIHTMESFFGFCPATIGINVFILTFAFAFFNHIKSNGLLCVIISIISFVMIILSPYRRLKIMTNTGDRRIYFGRKQQLKMIENVIETDKDYRGIKKINLSILQFVSIGIFIAANILFLGMVAISYQLI